MAEKGTIWYGYSGVMLCNCSMDLGMYVPLNCPTPAVTLYSVTESYATTTDVLTVLLSKTVFGAVVNRTLTKQQNCSNPNHHH